jgi:hypothetical protein
MTRRADQIVPLWVIRGNDAQTGAPKPGLTTTSTNLPSVNESDQAAVSAFFKTRTLCQWLGISIRSWTRAASLGLTPAPDLIVGRSPRWSPSTIERWLKTRPRLPGRKGGGE